MQIIHDDPFRVPISDMVIVVEEVTQYIPTLRMDDSGTLRSTMTLAQYQEWKNTGHSHTIGVDGATRKVNKLRHVIEIETLEQLANLLSAEPLYCYVQNGKLHVGFSE